jgi:para-aminobenzoate synthetase component 1
MALLEELPYRADSAAQFEAIADRPWAVFLDSGRPRARGGRYDILAADPYLTLATRGALTRVHARSGVSLSPQDPFALLRDALGERAAPIAGLPFVGGAIGWLGYDLGRRTERLPVLARDAEKIPDMAVGLYDWALVVDHDQRRCWLVGAGRDSRTRARWGDLVRTFSRPAPRLSGGFRLHGPVRSNMTRAQYAAAFARIQSYIRDGDCYQVNLAQRFAARATGDAWSVYRGLRRLNPAPFAAYLSTPFAKVMSSSPERFLSLRDGLAQTKPIKGTRPRGSSPEADSVLARALAESAKDRAENLMIVDLLRNDLGRVCRPGSVRVPELFAVESYAAVHHLVSTVTGELDAGEDATSLLRACFPGGSITGAPKIRAMEIIEALEPQRRGVYCGAIGYLGFDGAMDTNIAIRTLVHAGSTVRFWAGGGIVHDSDIDQEYQETFDKAAPLLRLLQGEPLADVGR